MTPPVELVDGQNLLWPGAVLTAELASARQCDLSALVLGPDAKVRDSDDFVFYNQPTAPGVSWAGGPPQSLSINLSTLGGPSAVLLLSVDPGEPELAAGNVTLSLAGELGVVARYSPRFSAGERAVLAIEVYQRGGAWKVRAFGQGYQSGLAELLRAHGVEVDDEPAPQPSQSAAFVAPPPQPAPASPTPPIFQPGDDEAMRQRRLLQQTVGILEDLRNSTASFTSTKDYAEHALTRELDELAADPRLRFGPEGDQRRAAARAKHDDMVERARANHERDLGQLTTELTQWQTTAPAPMVEWSAPGWQHWSPPAEPVTSFTAASLAPWHAPQLRVPVLIGALAPLVLWVDTEIGREHAPAVLRALTTRLLACFPAKQVRLQLISENPGLLQPLGGPGCRVLQSPCAGTAEAIRAVIGQLAHQADLAQMALDAGLEPPDATTTLLVISDFTLVPDVESLKQLAALGRNPRVVIVLACSSADDLAIATPGQVFDECHRVPCSATDPAMYEGEPEWLFSPDFGDDAVVSQVLGRLSRG